MKPLGVFSILSLWLLLWPLQGVASAFFRRSSSWRSLQVHNKKKEDNLPRGGGGAATQRKGRRRNKSQTTTPTPSTTPPQLLYTDKPLLRGEFHRIGALLYPPLLGLPLFVRSQPAYRVATLLFSTAVEGIMIISATLHTYPWTRQAPYQVARKADFAMIFIGIALFYSSMGKLLLGSAPLFATFVEPLVWMAALLGVTTKACLPDAPPWVNALIFLLQGWAIGPLLPTLFRTASRREAMGLLLGGIFITLGATAYSIQWPKGHLTINPDIFGPHEMFHIGTLAMFISFWFTMWIRVTT